MNQGLKLKTPIRNFSFHNILKCQERFKISNGVKILIISIAIFGAGFSFIAPVQAQPPPNLFVQFETTPLFNEANFIPGETVTRWIKVTNNSGFTQKIAIETINENDPDNFALQMALVIKEEAAILYQDTLQNFFNSGQTYLSNLANGATTQYDVAVTFELASGNFYQGKALGFDILVGFQGENGGGICGNNLKEIDEQCDGSDLSGQTCFTRGFSGGTLNCNTNCTGGGGGGGGSGLPSGLTILDESVRITEVGETNVTLIWTTSYFSTSQVIYGAEGEKHNLDLSDNTGSPPKYGYERTTLEYDISPKVTSHSITITGLTPGTTYYFRAVSHASLAISREYSFTTLQEKKQKVEITEEKPAEKGETPEISGEITEGKNKISGGVLPPASSSETGEAAEPEEPASNQLSQEETSEPKGGLGSLLASVGTFLKRISSSTFLIIILILVLIILALVVVLKIGKIFKEKKKRHK